MVQIKKVMGMRAENLRSTSSAAIYQIKFEPTDQDPVLLSNILSVGYMYNLWKKNYRFSSGWHQF